MNVFLPLFAMTATLLATIMRSFPWSGQKGVPSGPLAAMASVMWPDRDVSRRHNRPGPLAALAVPDRVASVPLIGSRRAPQGNIERIELGTVVERAIASAPSAGRHGLRHWVIDPALLQIELMADRVPLQAALASLIRRAVLHSRDGDFIAIRWSVSSERVAIVVEDEGDGLLDPDAEPDVGGELCDFGMNADRLCMSRCLPKLGQACEFDIGLNQAQRLVAAQGGDVRIEVAPGIGARAWLTLPRERVVGDAHCDPT
jgi:hypothetical protein